MYSKLFYIYIEYTCRLSTLIGIVVWFSNLTKRTGHLTMLILPQTFSKITNTTAFLRKYNWEEWLFKGPMRFCKTVQSNNVSSYSRYHILDFISFITYPTYEMIMSVNWLIRLRSCWNFRGYHFYPSLSSFHLFSPSPAETWF